MCLKCIFSSSEKKVLTISSFIPNQSLSKRSEKTSCLIEASGHNLLVSHLNKWENPVTLSVQQTGLKIQQVLGAGNTEINLKRLLPWSSPEVAKIITARLQWSQMQIFKFLVLFPNIFQSKGQKVSDTVTAKMNSQKIK